MEAQAFGKGNVPPGTAFMPTPVDHMISLNAMTNDIPNPRLHWA